MRWLPDVLRRSTNGSATEYVECRHCGQTIVDSRVACPECGSGEFAVYPAL